MPHCCEPEECINSCQEDIKDHDESSHPSCSLLFLGSTIVAYSIYQTAEWLLREQQEWFRRRRRQKQPPLCASPDSEPKSSTRRKLSKASSCFKKCIQRIHRHHRRNPQESEPLEQELGQLHQKLRAPFYQRLAHCGCCCFSSGDEDREINELHDQNREVVVHDEAGQEGEVTIIHFEQRDADGQRTAAAEETQQTARRQRRKSSAQLERERLRKARADKRWEETVDLTFRRVVYSIAGGTIVALTMFSGQTTRWSVIALGAGLGLGSALRDSAYILAG